MTTKWRDFFWINFMRFMRHEIEKTEVSPKSTIFYNQEKWQSSYSFWAENEIPRKCDNFFHAKLSDTNMKRSFLFFCSIFSTSFPCDDFSVWFLCTYRNFTFQTIFGKFTSQNIYSNLLWMLYTKKTPQNIQHFDFNIKWDANTWTTRAESDAYRSTVPGGMIRKSSGLSRFEWTVSNTLTSVRTIFAEIDLWHRVCVSDAASVLVSG